ncbi:MAG: hypothetical protein FWC26_02495 [Fibromonadales bacterium]|nr:hypothetical protein [Fibromonadales bacterium]
MRKKFIVCTCPSSRDAERLFINEIERYKINWWHWIPGIWFIIDESGIILADTIRIMAQNALGNNDIMVMEATGNINWAGYGPASSQGRGNMFSWIQEHWAKPDSFSISDYTPKLPTK